MPWQLLRVLICKGGKTKHKLIGSFVPKRELVLNLPQRQTALTIQGFPTRAWRAFERHIRNYIDLNTIGERHRLLREE